jgi:hypothetical protein
LALGTSPAIDAAATPRAASARPVGGGYLARPHRLDRASVAVRVPALTCRKSGPSATVKAGLHGLVRINKRARPWSVAVVASCAQGAASYVASTGGAFGSSHFRVNAADVVKLSQNGFAWEMDDRTTGHGVGGGASTTGQVSFRPRVLLGAHLAGRLAGKLTISMRAAKVNGSAVGTVSHRRQTQRRNGHLVVRPSKLAGRGTAFTLTIG